jgi:NAD(P)-dependent dehydrogenase (short-subunit alcohol dehydrogenase family)
MSKKLDGKIALITGGSTGIGLATAKQFVDQGAYVYITGRRQPELDAAVDTIGSSVTAIQGDVTKMADLDRIYAQIRKEKEHIDIVFANAGGGPLVSFGSITEEHFDAVFNLNVKALVFTAQKALPLLRNGGTIILTGSIVDIKGFPAFSIYSATKAAVRSFARTWTTDLKERGIRVNVVSPGPIDTPLLNEAFANPNDMKALASTVTVARRRSPKPSRSSRPRTPASSRVPSCMWMAARRRSDLTAGRAPIGRSAVMADHLRQARVPGPGSI